MKSGDKSNSLLDLWNLKRKRRSNSLPSKFDIHINSAMPYFTRRDIKLYYDISGQGTPILLINGLGGDTRSWGAVISALKSSRTIVNFDMSCAGRSDKEIPSFTVSDVADDAAALMRDLGFEKFDIAGHSMGGMVAIELALRYPEMAKTIYLISTAPSLAGPFSMPASTMELFERTEISPSLLTEVFNTIFGSKYKSRISAQEFIDFRLGDKLAQPIDAYLKQLAACKSFDRISEIEKIRAQTVIVTGSADRVIPSENSKWMHEKIENSRLIILEEIGHMVPLEAHEELSKILSPEKLN